MGYVNGVAQMMLVNLEGLERKYIVTESNKFSLINPECKICKSDTDTSPLMIDIPY